MLMILSGGFVESVLSMTEQLSGRDLDKAIEALRPDRGVYRTRQIAIANAWHYSTEWYRAGPLLEEMFGWVEYGPFAMGDWEAGKGIDPLEDIVVAGGTACEAIARAYLQWREEKGAGG